MSATQVDPSQAAAFYEQHLRQNWNSLSPYEQEEARAYLQSKFNGYAAPRARDIAPTWTIFVGYLCCVLALGIAPILLAPAGFGFGIYNAAKGRPAHGFAQIVLSIICGITGMILGVIVWNNMR